jgi:hypothetical protein
MYASDFCYLRRICDFTIVYLSFNAKTRSKSRTRLTSATAGTLVFFTSIREDKISYFLFPMP